MSLLLVEADVLVRYLLAEYLRECGYNVVEAVNDDEARQLLEAATMAIDIVLVDGETEGSGGFFLATWIRRHHPQVDVVLAGTIEEAIEKAGDLCEEGTESSRPDSHRVLLQRIRQQLAARDGGNSA